MKEPSLRVIIADDEPLAREAIRLRLENLKNISVIAEADNGQDALLLIETLSPDVVFLDIQMPKQTGLDVAEIININYGCIVVFITAYDKFAIQAFRQNALDYITKPIDDDEFNQMVEKVRHRNLELIKLNSIDNAKSTTTTSRGLKKLSIRQADQTIFVNVEDIFSIESVKDYLCIQTQSQVYIRRQTMKHMESQLNPDKFIRCHRSHIVNRDHVTKWLKEGNQDFLLVSDNKIPISKRYKLIVKQALGV